MEQVIQIQTRGGTVLHELDSAIQCRYSDRLSGAPTLHFVTQFRKVPKITADCVLYFGGNYYRITQLQKSVSEGRYLVTVSGEQESVSLTDEKLELFEFTGFASDALSRLLSGTGMLGTVETDGVVQIYMQNTNRRAVLLGIASAVGGEIDYRGHTIRIVGHRGNAVPDDLTDAAKVEDLTRTDTVNGGTEAYVLSCAGAEGFSVGDEVYIREPGLGIDVQRRIIGIQYDPFQDFLRTIEAGDYVPSIVDIYQKTQKAASDAARDSATAKDTAKKVEESLKDYVKASSLSASIDTYINEEAGKASIVAALKGTYVEEDALNGYVEKTSLSAEIGAYIDTQAGTAKIVSAASGVYQKIDDMGNYVKTTSLNTSIGQYLDTAAGKASIVSAVEGEFVSEADLTGLVKKTELSSSIGQYIDSTTGTSKILAKVSGVYQEKSGMGEYAKATALASIEASVSSVESKIELSSSYSKNTIGTNVQALLQLVTNANSSSIKVQADKIDFTGFSTFVRPSDLASNGTTTIDGGRITTGKISADRIEVDALKVNKIFGEGTYKETTLLYSEKNNLMLGGTSTSGTKVYKMDLYASNEINIFAASKVNIGSYSTKSIEIYTSATGGYIRPSLTGNIGLGGTSNRWDCLYTDNASIGSSTYYVEFDEKGSMKPSSGVGNSGYFSIGTTDKPFQEIYAKNITAKGALVVLGSSVKVGNNSVSTYYVDITQNMVAPSINNTSLTFNLGKSTAYWHNAYIGSTASYIGNSANSKIGFFGTTPAVRQTVANSATVAQLITALKKYGLIY